MAALASRRRQDSVDAQLLCRLEKAAQTCQNCDICAFDPAKKTSGYGNRYKGALSASSSAYTAVVALTAPSPSAAAIVDELKKQGFRFCVAADPRHPFNLSELSPSHPPHRIRVHSSRNAYTRVPRHVTEMPRQRRQLSLKR